MAHESIWDKVVRDMRQRERIGQQRYGGELLPNTGRDYLWDAYEEALDMCVYLRTWIEERKNDDGS